MSLRDRIDAALAAGAARTGNPPPPRRSVRPKSPTGTSDPDRSLPCVYRGTTAVRDKVCPTCPGAVTLKVFPCSSPAGYGECTVGKPVAGVRGCCGKCPGHVARTPLWREGGPVLKWDHRTLFPGLKGHRFNPSVLPDPFTTGGYVFCWRDGWAGSDLWACRLGPDFHPTTPAVRLDLFHPECNYGREDPQLFLYNGSVWVAFVGVVGSGGRVVHTSVLCARMDDRLRVASPVYAPKAPGVPRHQWQKNWQWFPGDDGALYAVYTIAPHRILRVSGDRAEWAFEEPCRWNWNGGERRGGASPVRVTGGGRDEWWSFFHDRVDRPGPGRKPLYRTGLYTFDVNPPFRPLRFVPDPIITANPATNPGNYVDCIFPRGAVRDGDDWVVSCGVHDRWTELHRLSHADLSARLRETYPPEGFATRSDTVDLGIFASVVGGDEYGTRNLNLRGGAVLDVGGHIGCFTYAAKLRGCGPVDVYEPYPESHRLLQRNTAGYGDVRTYNIAVGRDHSSGSFPTDHDVRLSGGWSVLPGNGPAVIEPLDAMIERLVVRSPNGRVRLLKIDCEGGEWPAFVGATRLDLVDEIVGEYHRYTDGDGRRWGPEDLRPLLGPHGFTVVYEDQPCGWGLFTARRTPHTTVVVRSSS